MVLGHNECIHLLLLIRSGFVSLFGETGGEIMTAGGGSSSGGKKTTSRILVAW